MKKQNLQICVIACLLSVPILFFNACKFDSVGKGGSDYYDALTKSPDYLDNKYVVEMLGCIVPPDDYYQGVQITSFVREYGFLVTSNKLALPANKTFLDQDVLPYESYKYAVEEDVYLPVESYKEFKQEIVKDAIDKILLKEDQKEKNKVYYCAYAKFYSSTSQKNITTYGDVFEIDRAKLSFDITAGPQRPNF